MHQEDIIINKIMKQAEDFFGTASDKRQIPVNHEVLKKARSLWKDSLLYELDEQGRPVSWVFVVPTQVALAQEFLRGVITERELFDRTKISDTYEALYLSSTFTVPTHRRQGLATKLIIRATSEAPLKSDAILLAWPTTKQGEGMLRKVEQIIGRTISLRH